jgi:hypothetical protein
LRCGTHELSVSSERLKISHKETLFLLPNQYVGIEVIAADTLLLHNYHIPYSMMVEDDVVITDSILNLYKPTTDACLDNTSGVAIWTGFNPFHTQ